jgi:ketosteroid isomerase-like protein
MALPVADTSATTVMGFIDRINAHDAHGIAALCTPDHIFVDSLGAPVSGRGQIEQVWEGYFSLFSDYRIEIEAVAATGRLVLLSGWASGKLRVSGAEWRIPAAWRALVRDELIAGWQVYADNKPVLDILSREGS